MRMQTMLRVIYPPQCLSCAGLVEEEGALCGTCWRNMPFLTGAKCLSCALPLPGNLDVGSTEYCDACMDVTRPWDMGHAALLYEGTARRLILSLKHGDRTELARPAARWMGRVLPPLTRDTIIVPVPLHWIRFLRRRYNQAALLAKHLASDLKLTYLPDALIRTSPTPSMGKKSVDARIQAIACAIQLNEKYAEALSERPILLVDDVMTSGATFTACAKALQKSKARKIDVIALARVAKT